MEQSFSGQLKNRLVDIYLVFVILIPTAIQTYFGNFQLNVAKLSKQNVQNIGTWNYKTFQSSHYQ